MIVATAIMTVVTAILVVTAAVVAVPGTNSQLLLMLFRRASPPPPPVANGADSPRRNGADSPRRSRSLSRSPYQYIYILQLDGYTSKYPRQNSSGKERAYLSGEHRECYEEHQSKPFRQLAFPVLQLLLLICFTISAPDRILLPARTRVIICAATETFGVRGAIRGAVGNLFWLALGVVAAKGAASPGCVNVCSSCTNGKPWFHMLKPIKEILYNPRLQYRTYVYPITEGLRCILPTSATHCNYGLSLLSQLPPTPKDSGIFAWSPTTDPTASSASCIEQPAFISLFQETLRNAHPQLRYLLSSRAKRQDGWIPLVDERAPVGWGRVAESDDTIGMCRVQDGEVLVDTFEVMPTYRLISRLGIFSLPRPLHALILDKLNTTFTSQIHPTTSTRIATLDTRLWNDLLNCNHQLSAGTHRCLTQHSLAGDANEIPSVLQPLFHAPSFRTSVFSHASDSTPHATLCSLFYRLAAGDKAPEMDIDFLPAADVAGKKLFQVGRGDDAQAFYQWLTAHLSWTNDLFKIEWEETTTCNDILISKIVASDTVTIGQVVKDVPVHEMLRESVEDGVKGYKVVKKDFTEAQWDDLMERGVPAEGLTGETQTSITRRVINTPPMIVLLAHKFANTQTRKGDKIEYHQTWDGTKSTTFSETFVLNGVTYYLHAVTVYVNSRRNVTNVKQSHHYKAYVCIDHNTNRWFEFNDSAATPSSIANIGDNGFMFYYVREDTRQEWIDLGAFDIKSIPSMYSVLGQTMNALVDGLSMLLEMTGLELPSTKQIVKLAAVPEEAKGVLIKADDALDRVEHDENNAETVTDNKQ
ncbi:hypothetical protein PSACC_02892 [Paramicrosporidium saccamoebae]|uniref:USP domain-containing protein n=1 Tax=Paramicrosporidium saccamoebae TaxID=1246581 RepID=A0A2H9THR7_9FUNG|nr:hypothetical protein PSACC_02892 [Paramicrosporidium saccamoebae]